MRYRKDIRVDHLNWQEYQEAVGELYSQMEGIGEVLKNITILDRITNQPRQVDVWLEVDVKGHKIGILVDAKYRKHKVDVKDVEEVLALANAVGANKSVLVALNGWTAPAETKAKAVGLDLKLWTLEEALDLMVPDKWLVCPGCENDCIVIDCVGGMVVDGMWSLLTAGRCRECQMAAVYCWDCGERMFLNLKEQGNCGCGHSWKNSLQHIQVKAHNRSIWNEVSGNVPLLDPEATDAHIQKGLELKAAGKFPEAIEELTKAIDKSPISAIAFYQRAIVLDEYGYLDEAIQDYTQAIEYNPEYAMAYGSRGIAFYASGLFIEAVADLEHYLSLDPASSNRMAIANAIQRAKTAIVTQQDAP